MTTPHPPFRLLAERLHGSGLQIVPSLAFAVTDLDLVEARGGIDEAAVLALAASSVLPERKVLDHHLGIITTTRAAEAPPSSRRCSLVAATWTPGLHTLLLDDSGMGDDAVWVFGRSNRRRADAGGRLRPPKSSDGRPPAASRSRKEAPARNDSLPAPER